MGFTFNTSMCPRDIEHLRPIALCCLLVSSIILASILTLFLCQDRGVSHILCKFQRQTLGIKERWSHQQLLHNACPPRRASGISAKAMVSRTPVASALRFVILVLAISASARASEHQLEQDPRCPSLTWCCKTVVSASVRSSAVHHLLGLTFSIPQSLPFNTARALAALFPRIRLDTGASVGFDCAHGAEQCSNPLVYCDGITIVRVSSCHRNGLELTIVAVWRGLDGDQLCHIDRLA